MGVEGDAAGLEAVRAASDGEALDQGRARRAGGGRREGCRGRRGGARARAVMGGGGGEREAGGPTVLGFSACAQWSLLLRPQPFLARRMSFWRSVRDDDI